jgi:hypothetical protein
VTTDLITHALAVLAGACAILAFALFLRTQNRAAILAHANDKARRDAAFAEWSKWTFLSITDREGQLFYSSLYDLQDAPPDMIWPLPGSVLLFHADPEDPTPYKEITHG